MLGAGDRVAGHEMHPFRQVRTDVGDRALLGRADVGDDRARPQPRRDRPRDLAVTAERRAQHDEVGAIDAGARIGGGEVGDAQRAGLVERRMRSGADRDVVGEPSRRTTRASDEPIRPMPISAIRSKRGGVFGPRSCDAADEVRQRRHAGAHLGFQPDGHPQAVGQAVGSDAPGDDAARLQVSIGGGASRPGSAGKRTSTKLPWLSGTARPRAAIAAGPPPPVPVVPPRALDERLIGERRHPRRLRRAGDVERHAQPVEHVGDRQRAVGPAEAQPPRP